MQVFRGFVFHFLHSYGHIFLLILVQNNDFRNMSAIKCWYLKKEASIYIFLHLNTSFCIWINLFYLFGLFQTAVHREGSNPRPSRWKPGTLPLRQSVGQLGSVLMVRQALEGCRVNARLIEFVMQEDRKPIASSAGLYVCKALYIIEFSYKEIW